MWPFHLTNFINNLSILLGMKDVSLMSTKVETVDSRTFQEADFVLKPITDQRQIMESVTGHVPVVRTKQVVNSWWIVFSVVPDCGM